MIPKNEDMTQDDCEKAGRLFVIHVFTAGEIIPDPPY